ncbi:hypothetical protein Tco_0140510 [Tanacetum coccineum]
MFSTASSFFRLLEMDLFAFIRHSDPTKVRVGERNLADREVKLLKMTEGRTVALDPPATAAPEDSGDSIDRLFDEGNNAGQEHSVENDDNVLEEAIAKNASEVVAEKAKRRRKGKETEDASGSIYPPKKLITDYHGATEPLITTSVAPMPDVGPVDSMSGLNLRIRPPHVRYVVSSDGSHHSGSYSEATSFVRLPAADAPVVTVAVTTTVDANVAAGSKAKDAPKDFEHIGDSMSAGGVNADAANISKLKKPSTSSDSFYASQSLDTETMHHIYVPRWKVTNDSILEDPYVCRDMTDRLAPPALFAQLRAMDYDQLYSKFNVGAAGQVCLGAEVRMRAEHTLEMRGELEDRCAEQTTLLSEKDAEIAHLKSILSLKEIKAVEAISLRSQLSIVEDTDAAMSTELRDLKEKNFALEGEREMFCPRRLPHLSPSLLLKRPSWRPFLLRLPSLLLIYPASSFLRSSLESAFELFRERAEAMQDKQAKALGGRALGQAIGCAVNKGIQDGLKAGIDHGKAGRDLSVVKAYDPSAEEKYVDVVNTLGAVDFSLLSELESKKDSSIADLMDSLRLEGFLAEIPRAENLQPSLEQLMLPVYRSEDNVLFAETPLSSSIEVISVRAQRFREEAKEKRLSLTDVMTPFIEHLSSKSLIGEASSSAAPITTFSTTFVSSIIIPPSSLASDQVLDEEPHNEDPPVVTFEKEELGTSPK